MFKTKTNITVVDGTTKTGLFASDGSYNVVDSAEAEGFVGVYHPCGALNVTFETLEAYAPNGSLGYPLAAPEEEED
jgi:hypothetical protein